MSIAYGAPKPDPDEELADQVAEILSSAPSPLWATPPPEKAEEVIREQRLDISRLGALSALYQNKAWQRTSEFNQVDAENDTLRKQIRRYELLMEQVMDRGYQRDTWITPALLSALRNDNFYDIQVCMETPGYVDRVNDPYGHIFDAVNAEDRLHLPLYGLNLYNLMLVACARMSPQAVAKLLECGADPNVLFHGSTALVDACRAGRVDMATVLLAGGANPNLRNDPDNTTAFLQAARNGHGAVLELLIANHVDTSCIDAQGRNALAMAVGRGQNDDVVTFLLNRGFDINSTDAAGLTALAHAIDHGRLPTIVILIQRGANVNLAGYNNITPLMSAVAIRDPHMVQALLAAGAQPNIATTVQHETALHVAADNGDLAIVQLLIAHHADLNIPYHDGYTALQFAETNGHANVVKALRDAGADRTQ
jgi:ankyrin repeat protein